MKKLTKNQLAAVEELNAVIHTRNLYAGNSRFINAHYVSGRLCVENLSTGQIVPVDSLAPLRDGNGYPVVVV